MRYHPTLREENGTELRGIKFSILSPKMVRKMGIVEITSSKVNHEGRPVMNGVNSPLMGVVSGRFPCRTCGEKLGGKCVGHPGYLEFPFPVYHVGFRDQIARILKHVCYWCCHLLFQANDQRFQKIEELGELTAWQRFYELTPTSKVYRGCKNCGRWQPKYDSSNARINATWTQEAQANTLDTERDPEKRAEMGAIFERPFVPADAQRILLGMKDEELELLGLDPRESHPAWAVMVNMVVPPPVVRPGAGKGDGSRSFGQNQLTQRLRDITRKKEEIEKVLLRRFQNHLPLPWYLFTPDQRSRLIAEIGFAEYGASLGTTRLLLSSGLSPGDLFLETEDGFETAREEDPGFLKPFRPLALPELRQPPADDPGLSDGPLFRQEEEHQLRGYLDDLLLLTKETAKTKEELDLLEDKRKKISSITSGEDTQNKKKMEQQLRQKQHQQRQQKALREEQEEAQKRQDRSSGNPGDPSSPKDPEQPNQVEMVEKDLLGKGMNLFFGTLQDQQSPMQSINEQGEGRKKGFGSGSGSGSGSTAGKGRTEPSSKGKGVGGGGGGGGGGHEKKREKPGSGRKTQGKSIAKGREQERPGDCPVKVPPIRRERKRPLALVEEEERSDSGGGSARDNDEDQGDGEGEGDEEGLDDETAEPPLKKLRVSYREKKEVNSHISVSQKKKMGETDTLLGSVQQHYGLLPLMEGLQELVGGIIKPEGRTGAGKDRSTPNLQSSLKGKRGRFRQNLVGKRVDQCARSVIGVAPHADVDEVYCSEETATTLTYTQNVTFFNREELKRKVLVGPKKIGGAHAVLLKKKDHYTEIPLEFFKGDRKEIELEVGDAVECYLAEGQQVLFNRHPSLHKGSMLCHRVRFHKEKTMALPETDCTTYNADFDGDEMNLHVPQNELGRSEAQFLMSVEENMLTPRSNSPNIFLIQDGVVLSFLLTNRDTFFTRSEVMQLMMSIRHTGYRRGLSDMTLPIPAILRPKMLWTGKQLVSWILPEDFTMRRNVRGLTGCISSGMVGFSDPKEREIIILKGELLAGRFCSQVVGKSHHSLVHLMVLDKGNRVAAHFLTNLKQMLFLYARKRGCSLGIPDLILPAELRETTRVLIQRVEELVTEFQRENPYPEDPAESERHEIKLTSLIVSKLTKMLENSIRSQDNLFATIVYSGAKGSPVSLVHMMACVGQQFYRGKRFWPERRRVLPSEPLGGSTSIYSRGFVNRSLMEGLTVEQFYLSTVIGRDCMIDVGVRTSEIGYTSRTIQRCIESKVVREDGTVRDSSNRIVQFSYGADGLDGTYLERVTLETLFMDERELAPRLCPPPPEVLVRKDESEWSQEVWEHVAQLHLQVHARVMGRLRRCFSSEPFQGDPQFTSPISCKRLRETLELERRGRLNMVYRPRGVSGLGGPDPGKFLDHICTPLDCWKIQERFLNRTLRDLGEKENNLLVLRASVLESLSPHVLVGALLLSKGEVEGLYQKLERAIVRARVAPGEAVGCLASESISQPSMQMTLNTFHFAGAHGPTPSMGLPRLRELIRSTKGISTPTCQMPIKPWMTNHRGEKVLIDEDLARTEIPQTLRGIRLMDIIQFTCVIPREEKNGGLDHSTEVKTAVIYQARRLKPDCGSYQEAHRLLGDVCFLMIINATKMRQLEIKIEEVLGVLSRNLPGGVNLVTYMKPENISEGNLSLRLYLKNYSLACKGLKITSRLAKSVDGHRHLLGVLTEKICLRGLPYVTDCMITMNPARVQRNEKEKGGKKPEPMRMAAVTSGCDLANLLCQPLPHFNKRYLLSNHVYQTFLTLGIDAAAACLYREICLLLSYEDIYVDKRHILMLTDSICFSGRLVPMSRDGIKQTENSTLLRASFEKTLDNLLQGFFMGSLDPIAGISENIMAGKKIPAGTGCIDILPDPGYVSYLPNQRETSQLTTQRLRKVSRGSSRSTSSLLSTYSKEEENGELLGEEARLNMVELEPFTRFCLTLPSIFYQEIRDLERSYLIGKTELSSKGSTASQKEEQARHPLNQLETAPLPSPFSCAGLPHSFEGNLNLLLYKAKTHPENVLESFVIPSHRPKITGNQSGSGSFAVESNTFNPLESRKLPSFASSWSSSPSSSEQGGKAQLNRSSSGIPLRETPHVPKKGDEIGGAERQGMEVEDSPVSKTNQALSTFPKNPAQYHDPFRILSPPADVDPMELDW